MSESSQSISDSNTEMPGQSKTPIKLKIGEKSKQSDIKVLSTLQCMARERFSLTCAPGGENHAGMEIIGRMPIEGEGLTAIDMEGLCPYFQNLEELDNDDGPYGHKSILLDLNALSGVDVIRSKGWQFQARVIILRDWLQHAVGHNATQAIYKEIAADEWDAEYLDKNKYRTEIIDGKEIRIRGKKMNKRARTNLCYVAGREQEPAVMEGRGRIVDLKKKTVLFHAVEKLRKMITDGLISIGSKTKVEINVVEGNRYYNLKSTGIGFHGDTERVIVICISIGGGGNYPMRWQWFKDGMPVGETIDITLNDGDVYIMSEKAVGADWKLRSIYTIRHAAGAEKYRSLKKWNNRRPAYEDRLKAKEEKQCRKVAEMFAKQAARDAAKALKNKKLSSFQVAKNDKKNKGKTTKGGALKKVDPEKVEFKEYRDALKNHDWQDSDASFYRWVTLEAEHKCSPNSDFFKDFQAIWTGKVEKFSEIELWESQRTFYRNLCAYSKYF